MPNIKSASKRVELSRAAEAANKAKKSALKTTIKKFDAAVAAGNKEEAAVAYKVAVKAIDKAAVTGLIHKNNAARKKSRLTLSINAM
ncbi:MAG: 30S ribosomal protein S20 [Clostridiales bacterium]|nr:30S ribosomal protein S20 [Clostridiales bacterium]